MPVVEIARLTCQPGTGNQFVNQLELALAVIAESPDCGHISALRGIEDPDSFVLTVQWTSVESHLAFRASPAFNQYRSHVAHLLASTPDFAHFSVVIST